MSDQIICIFKCFQLKDSLFWKKYTEIFQQSLTLVTTFRCFSSSALEKGTLSYSIQRLVCNYVIVGNISCINVSTKQQIARSKLLEKHKSPLGSSTKCKVFFDPLNIDVFRFVTSFEHYKKIPRCTRLNNLQVHLQILREVIPGVTFLFVISGEAIGQIEVKTF